MFAENVLRSKTAFQKVKPFLIKDIVVPYTSVENQNRFAVLRWVRVVICSVLLRVLTFCIFVL